jgi:CheY-like chemotaxis protein
MSTAAPAHRRPRVLLVEDGSDVFELYRDLFASLDYDVIGASDGEAAIEQATNRLPDVIVMDLGQPKLDGCAATARLKADERTRHIPVLMLSGYVQPEVMARARKCGCDAYFIKPLALDRLVAEVRARIPSAAAPPRVMVVEDDDDVRRSLVEVLDAEGFGVIEAENGAAALERLRQGPLPRLILLDLMMPVMDGWTFRDLQRENPEWAAIPTVILSAVPEARQSAARLAAAGYLIKPVDLPLLINTVERHAA